MNFIKIFFLFGLITIDCAPLGWNKRESNSDWFDKNVLDTEPYNIEQKTNKDTFPLPLNHGSSIELLEKRLDPIEQDFLNWVEEKREATKVKTFVPFNPDKRENDESFVPFNPDKRFSSDELDFLDWEEEKREASNNKPQFTPVNPTTPTTTTTTTPTTTTTTTPTTTYRAKPIEFEDYNQDELDFLEWEEEKRTAASNYKPFIPFNPDRRAGSLKRSEKTLTDLLKKFSSKEMLKGLPLKRNAESKNEDKTEIVSLEALSEPLKSNKVTYLSGKIQPQSQKTENKEKKMIKIPENKLKILIKAVQRLNKIEKAYRAGTLGIKTDRMD